MHVARRPAAAGQHFELAVEMLRELQRARAEPGHGLSPIALGQRLRVDPLQLEPVIEALVALDWVAWIDESGAQRLVLLADPQATPAAPLVKALLLAPTAPVGGFWRRARFDEMTLEALIER
jgi:membrane protein